MANTNIAYFIGRIAFALLCAFISALIHELGHAFVALRYGWKLSWLVIGPIGLKRNEADRLVLYFEKNPALWGGMVSATPVKECDDNIKIFTKSLLGGPIVSIIIGFYFC